VVLVVVHVALGGGGNVLGDVCNVSDPDNIALGAGSSRGDDRSHEGGGWSCSSRWGADDDSLASGPWLAVPRRLDSRRRGFGRGRGGGWSWRRSSGSGNCGRRSCGRRSRCGSRVDGRRGRRRDVGSVAVVVLSTQGDGDGSTLVAGSLHAIGIIGGVLVGTVSWLAGRVVRGEEPVAVPWVAVDVAHVVPDDAVIEESVLVLHNVVHAGAVGELEGPAHVVGQLSVGLAVGVAGLESLVYFGVHAIIGRSVLEVHVGAALVDNDGLADRVCCDSGREGCDCDDCALHCD